VEPSTPDPALTTWAATSERPWVRFLRTSLGPLLLMLSTPPAALLAFGVCRHLDGSVSRLLTAEGWRILIENWPMPTARAALMLADFAAFQLVLLRVLPGSEFLGPVTPTGARPRYRQNGVLAWAVTHGAFFGLSLGAGLFSAGILWDELGPMLMTLVPFALAFCLFLYLKGRFAPTSTDRSVTGNFLWDYYWGVELHPTLFGLNLKQLINCRISMMGWSLLVCSFAAKQGELLGGAPTPGMLVSAAILVLYLFKFFWWETGYFTSLDIMHDRFGFYICWGVLSWVPAIYPIAQQYLVTHPDTLSVPAALAVFALGVGAIWANYAADAQRQRVRATDGKTTVWGRPPEVIRARYETADGRQHESLLLTSGDWGLARHFHYVPEITLAFAWSLPAGFGHFLPMFYVVFLTILLLDRATRDDQRCAKKYGTYWDEYRKRVPYKVVPGVS
jgi:7-dehydrocholesterol reductase